jgi:structural hemagglutinin/hemolysin toxin protein RtxA
MYLIGLYIPMPEYYVQMICSPEHIHAVVTTLKSAHPYEEPAYHVIKMERFDI